MTSPKPTKEQEYKAWRILGKVFEKDEGMFLCSYEEGQNMLAQALADEAEKAVEQKDIKIHQLKKDVALAVKKVIHYADWVGQRFPENLKSRVYEDGAVIPFPEPESVITLINTLEAKIADAVAEERERIYKLAETWDCSCHIHYPKGEKQYHGVDCQKAIVDEFVEAIREQK